MRDPVPTLGELSVWGRMGEGRNSQDAEIDAHSISSKCYLLTHVFL